VAPVHARFRESVVLVVYQKPTHRWGLLQVNSSGIRMPRAGTLAAQTLQTGKNPVEKDARCRAKMAHLCLSQDYAESKAVHFRRDP
jgi:hypothetical protein